MKRSTGMFVLLLSVALATPAFAGGPGYHGGRHYHGGHRHHGGWNHHWVGPVLGAAIVGTAIYAASTPTYAAPPPVVSVYPPVVTVYPSVVTSAPPAPRVAYFCATSQQYYPVVPTCSVPWQAVSY